MATPRRLTALTFLAPNMLPVYQFLMDTIGRKIGCKIELRIGSEYQEVLNADLSFICGLPYVLWTQPRRSDSPIEAIAAPVLQRERFQNRPIYFSNVIVRHESHNQLFAGLRGCRWTYTSRSRSRVILHGFSMSDWHNKQKCKPILSGSCSKSFCCVF